MEQLVVLGLLAAVFPIVLHIIAIVRARRGAQHIRLLEAEHQDLCLESDTTRKQVASLITEVTNLRHELAKLAYPGEGVSPPPTERNQPPVAPAVIRVEPESATSTEPILAPPYLPTVPITEAQPPSEQSSEIPTEKPSRPDHQEVPPTPPGPPAGSIIEWERLG